MSLKLLRKSAIDFTPNAGSNISFDTDHLKCDDYVMGDVPLNAICLGRRTDGHFRCATSSNWSLVYKFGSDLSYLGQTTLQNVLAGWTEGMCIDDENKIWIVHNAAATAIQRYNDDGTLFGNYGSFSYGRGPFYYSGNDHIYFGQHGIASATEMAKDGTVIHTEAGINTAKEVYVDSNGIYVSMLDGIMHYDLSWNYIEKIQYQSGDFPPNHCRYSIKGFRPKGESNLLIIGDAGYSMVGMMEITKEATPSLVRILAEIENSNPGMGGLSYDYNIFPNSLLIDDDEKVCYVADQVDKKIIKYDLRDASERYATMEYDFGSSVNIKRLNINALYDNRDESWKSMRLWYQLNAGGYNEVDLKNPVLDINGQILGLKVGMTSYGFTRNWPELYSIDIVYDDGQTPAYKSNLVANLQTKSTLNIGVQNKNTITVRLRNEP